MPDETTNESGAGFFGKVWARFGEVARRLGIVHEHDVNEALEHQETTVPRKKLGEILVEKGKMTDDHVKAILREQLSGGSPGAPGGRTAAPELREPTIEAAAKESRSRPTKARRKAAKKVAKKSAKKGTKKSTKKAKPKAAKKSAQKATRKVKRKAGKKPGK
jgi:hypothetical protein